MVIQHWYILVQEKNLHRVTATANIKFKKKVKKLQLSRNQKKKIGRGWSLPSGRIQLRTTNLQQQLMPCPSKSISTVPGQDHLRAAQNPLLLGGTRWAGSSEGRSCPVQSQVQYSSITTHLANSGQSKVIVFSFLNSKETLFYQRVFWVRT